MDFVQHETSDLSTKVMNLQNAYEEYLDVEQVFLLLICYLGCYENITGAETSCER